MKYLIVGLGNPGSEYAETRHNIGFKVLDEIASELGVSFALDKAAFKAEAKFKGRQLVLIKPITYMNLSGKAVNYWLQTEKINVSNLLVVTDDIALPFGTLRLKGKGSDGGHNGLKDIQATLKTQEYAKGRQADYVLGEWKTDERLALPERITTAAAAAKSFVFDGLPMAMTNWNNK
jgi:PTH1 family peptidyl-tRNA hydrolase